MIMDVEALNPFYSNFAFENPSRVSRASASLMMRLTLLRMIWAGIVPAASEASLWTHLVGSGSWCDPLRWNPRTQYPDDGNGGLTLDVVFGIGTANLNCGAISIQGLDLTA